MFMDRELSKQYLSGKLSPRENYQIESRLLENDFSYDAIEGLEQVSWDQCQKQLEAVEARIIRELTSKQNQGLGRKLSLGLIGILTTLTIAWYFTAGNSSSIDLSNRQVAATGTPPAKQVKETSAPEHDLRHKTDTPGKSVTPKNTNLAGKSSLGATASERNQPLKLQTVKTSEVATVKSKAVETRITVGRIIDAKGIPVTNAKVLSGNMTDITDKSGYYALKVPGEGIMIKVRHLATEYEVEIDANQNWEIKLDIVQQAVIDYYPMNAANRFK
jgi:hypothetical protein